MVFSLLLALSLSVDALGIGLSYGLRRITFSPSSLLLLTGETFFMMEIFLRIGQLFAACFPAALAEGISTGFLLFFGIWLCLQGTGQKKKKEDSPLQSPSLCDKDASSSIEPKEALLLGFLLSMDSFAIGVSAAAGGMDVVLLPVFAALFQTVFLALGAMGGQRLRLHPAPKESLWSLLSGSILIFLALLQFFRR
ncbi:manganese efflux pump [Anaerotignum sp.]